jgi:predicted TIM-barrel fold metal-dependent hydrolase
MQARVIDADSHLYEPRSLWRDFTDSSRRDRALHIEDDALGYPWLTLGTERIEVLGVHQPGDTSQSGHLRERLREGLPAEDRYDDMPADFWDPVARLATLDRLGIDETIALPNCGIMWERALGPDLEATTINMSAWNRWAVEAAQQGGGRLHPVGHLTLRDPEWVAAEVPRLAAGGVRLAMVAPALVDGRRLSHPDHERMWATLADHGIGVVFHIAQYEQPFDDAWNEGDPDWSNPFLSSVFMWTAPALALADLVGRGVLARHPRLRIGIIELMSAWVPLFLLQLDGAFRFYESFNGQPLTTMELAPSDYVRRQVRVASFPYEHPERLARQADDIFMFGSDYPHPEGLADPVTAFRDKCGLAPDAAPAFFHDNAAWLLGAA